MKLITERRATTAVFLAHGFGTGAWAVTIPRLQERLGLSHAALGTALFAFACGAIVAMLLVGRLARRMGSGRGTAWLGLVFVLLLPVPALVPGFGMLCAALFALGAANAAMDVSMNGHASAVEAHGGRPIMSSFHAAWSLGGLLGSSLGAALQGMGLGAAAGLALPDLAIAAVLLVAALGALGPVGRGAPAPGGGLALPSAALLQLAGLACGCMLVEGAVADWSAVYLRSVLAGRAGEAGLGYAAFALAMAACRLVGDRSVGRFGSGRVVTAGGLFAAIGFSLVLGLPSVATACLGFGLVGVGLANIVPVIFSAAGRSTPVPAVGVAMAATAGYAGFLVGPPLIGLSADRVGLRCALGALVLASLAVALFGGRAVARHPGLAERTGPRLPLGTASK